MSNLAETYDWLPPVPPRRFKLLRGEREVWRLKEKPPATDWAQGNRHVAVGPATGAYDVEVTPYAKGLLNLFSEIWLTVLYLSGGSQSAKSDIMHTALGYCQEHEPGPALVVMQEKTTGSEVVQERLIPMFRYTPTLRKLLTKNPKDLSTTKIRLRNAAITYLAWANSESRLASKPIRYGMFDEVDLWPEWAVTKAWARLKTFIEYGMAKVIEACTTSTVKGRIWQAQKEAQALWDFYAVCPFCGHAQTMKFGGIHWAEGVVDPVQLQVKGSAWYECEGKGCKWDEEDRNEAVRLGTAVHDPPSVYYGWRPRPESVLDKPSSVWAHIPPLISPFVSFNSVAAAYLKQHTNPTAANVAFFWNDCLGLPVPENEEGVDIQEVDIYKRREQYGPDGASWVVPMAACVLTADVDIQDNRIECEVMAWGPGHENWGIEYRVFRGFTQKEDKVWDDLHNFLQDARFLHESGVPLRIAAAGIDAGFGSRKVSKFVQRDPSRYIAHKGSNIPSDPLVPRRPTKGKYGVPIYILGTHEGKDDLFSWLTAGEDRNGQFIPMGPRACHFPMNYDFDYFKMLCAEAPKWERCRKTGKMIKVYKLREGYSRNESLDIKVGNMAVREILNPDYEQCAESIRKQLAELTAEEKETEIKSKPVPKAGTDEEEESERFSSRSRPGWFGRGR